MLRSIFQAEMNKLQIRKTRPQEIEINLVVKNNNLLSKLEQNRSSV